MGSRYSQQEETEIVRDAMKLTAAIQTEQSELARLKAERFRLRPEPPKREPVGNAPVILIDYPPKPQTSLTFNDYLFNYAIKEKKTLIIISSLAILLMIVLCVVLDGTDNLVAATVFEMLSVLAGIGLIVGFIVSSSIGYRRKRNAINAELENDPEYQQARRAAENYAGIRQQEADEKYRAELSRTYDEYVNAMEVYNSQTVPTYEMEYAEWKEVQAKKIALVEEVIKSNSELLQEIYDTTRIISVSYRELRTLEYLYEDMNSSDHDIRYATELFDRNRQRILTEQVGYMVRDSIVSMNESITLGLGAVYDSIEEGNELQEETNRLLRKTRREMNFGHIVLGILSRKKY